jgi:SH3-like domain-containing protein
MMMFRAARLPFVSALVLFVASLTAPVLAAEVNVDGLPVPRFVSVRSGVLVRVGPGKKYDLAWTYNKVVPVEVTAEFDIWRKIRDSEGGEGWVQQNQLSGSRVGVVIPPKDGPTFPLLASASEAASVRAYLGPGLRLGLRKCDGAWCQVDTLSEAGGPTYSGYVKQTDLWGVYQNESF